MTWQEFSDALAALARKMPTTTHNPLNENLVHVKYAMDTVLAKVRAAARYEAMEAEIAARRAS